MKILVALALFVALALNAQAAGIGTGTCTIGVVIGSSSCTSVFPAQDVSGGRHFLLIQCVGLNNCFCAFNTLGQGTANLGAATDGIAIGSQGSPLIMNAFSGGPATQIPNTDVCCRTQSGASEVVGCDF